ncbi:MAG: hypothetical protein KGR98_05600 [Verrucomicrobia bacterium]|nr:hypothetical protein [Verrucomicrobiota bacterium]
MWGHVIYGSHLLQTGTLMRADPYSWTANGHPWINHEILAEAAMALSFRALGGPGLLLLTVAVGLLTFFLALATASAGMVPGRTRIVAWALGALAVVEISYGFAVRPQIFTALALAAELWILRRIHEGRLRWAFALPPLFAAWINTHGGVVAGILLLFAAAGATTAQCIFNRFNLDVVRLEKPPAKIVPVLWIACAFSAAALFLNPYGAGLIRWLSGSVSWLRPQITEWNPVSLGWNHAAFFFCAALAAVALLLSPRRRQLWEAAVLVLLAAAAFRSVRNTPLFCIAALALAPPGLAGVLERFENRFANLTAVFARSLAQKFLTLLLCVASAGILAATAFLHKQRAWTMEVPRNQYPVAAIQFIRARDLRGNLLVFFDWGEICLWELPRSRVSMDGRLDTCYPRRLITAHWRFYNAEPFDTNVLDLRRADFALLPSHLAGSMALAKMDDWRPVYFDNLAVVLVKNLNQFPKLAGLPLPIRGRPAATRGRAAFPNHLPQRRE